MSMESGSGVQIDVLGEPYFAETIDLPDDEEGAVVATLVSRRADRPTTRAVLHLHGFADYFFQVPAADYWVSRGYDFYALDLRKYGRSLRPAEPHPNFCRALEEYYPEITAALDIILAHGHDWVLLNGHSTGGLLAARYMQDGPRRGRVNALFLNSPFFDFNLTPMEMEGVRAMAALGKLFPFARRQDPVSKWYGRSLHRDHYGEWTFSDARKPLDGFPAFFGWIRAIRLGQQLAARGGIDVPVLLLHSSRSIRAGKQWSDDYRRADIVLDVEDMKRIGPALGPRVTIHAVEGAVHDVVLSNETARTEAIARLGEWIQLLTADS